jgi:hypothetical protein
MSLKTSSPSSTFPDDEDEDVEEVEEGTEEDQIKPHKSPGEEGEDEDLDISDD